MREADPVRDALHVRLTAALPWTIDLTEVERGDLLIVAVEAMEVLSAGVDAGNALEVWMNLKNAAAKRDRPANP